MRERVFVTMHIGTVKYEKIEEGNDTHGEKKVNEIVVVPYIISM